MEVESPGEELLKSYNVSVGRIQELNLPIESIGVITHIVHQDPRIVCAGIFGSRADENAEVTDSSDIDLGIVVDDYDQDKIAGIDFNINRKYRQITGDETEVHVCSLNKGVNHSADEKDVDAEFRDIALEQMVVLKGSMTDFEH